MFAERKPVHPHLGRAFLCLTGSWLVFLPAAMACQCRSSRGDLARSDAVFLGTVEEMAIEDPTADVADDRQVAMFHVQRAWKGITISPQIVASSIPDCGVSFIPGRAYLVFARGDATGRLLTGQCDGTKRVQDATAELDRLGAAQTWPVAPLDKVNAIRLALRFWQTCYGPEVRQLSIDNPPHVDDLGRAWRLWVLTSSHQLVPLEVEIDKETYEVSDMRRK